MIEVMLGVSSSGAEGLQFLCASIGAEDIQLFTGLGTSSELGHLSWSPGLDRNIVIDVAVP